MPSPLSSVYKHKDYSGQQIVFLFLRYPVNKGRWITFSVPIQRYYIPEHPVSNPTPDYHILHYHGLFSVASQHSQSWVQTCCCLTISQFSFTHECQCVCQLAHVVYWVPVQGAPCPLPCASWDRLQPWTGYNTVSGCWKWMDCSMSTTHVGWWENEIHQTQLLNFCRTLLSETLWFFQTTCHIKWLTWVEPAGSQTLDLVKEFDILGNSLIWALDEQIYTIVIPLR